MILALLVAVGLAWAGEEAAVVEGNNRFAADLLGRVREEEDGNLVFSPASLSTALAMAYAGARGETAEEMARVLHLDRDQERVHADFGAWAKALGGEGKPYRLDVANALWVGRDEDLLPGFVKTLETHYGAGEKAVDFDSPDEARRVINEWVAEKTAGKIRDLLQPPLPEPGTSLVLTNAVYFKGKWAQPFPASFTKDEPFRLAGGKEAPAVPMMQQTGPFGLYQGEGFKVLELIYEGGDLAMQVWLPDAEDGLAALEEKFSAGGLAEAGTKLARRPVRVTLPRFRAETALDLGKTLAAMGMPGAFGPGADFSGINGKRDLSISAVVHKAFVDVNEEGTEAAAATGVAIGRTSIARPTPPVEFRADHPFLFAIVHRPTSGVLFLGRVADPRK
jgi:serpin B